MGEKTIVFLTRPGNYETIDKIGEDLDCEYEVVSKNHIESSEYSPYRDYVLVRWGSVRDYGPRIPKFILNTRGAIKQSSHKHAALITMRDADIPIPQLENPYKLMEYLSRGFFHRLITPLIGRTNYHMAGEGFWLCRNREDIENALNNGADYFMRLYPKTNEYRVHVGSGKVLFIQEKTGGDYDQPIWNHENGFDFDVVRKVNWNSRMCEIAVRAVTSLGLHFGAVDILANPDIIPNFVVVEVNTAPALFAYGHVKYAIYFNKLLQSLQTPC